jgi:ABC-type Fe3+ transport system substrate-binding protein
MKTLTRRTILRIGALGIAGTVACARAVEPGTAVVVPAAPETPPVASAPPPHTPAPASPVRDVTRPVEWERLVAAARSEGRLSLVTLANRGWTTVFEAFERAFPGVAVGRLAESSAPVWWDALRRGRAAGSQSFDLAFVQPVPALAGAAEGVWAPLRPRLSRRDVLDDGAWRGGFGARFLDAGAALCFDWEYQVHHAYAVKTDLVGEGEITSVTDLLDLKWRGKVLSSDPRSGNALQSATSVASHHGRDVLKRLLVDQQPSIIPTDGWDAAQAEAFVKGSFPIAQGLRPKPLTVVREKGLAANVAFLDLPDADIVQTIGMLYVDGAPHPAAAELFANWILTREGQTILTSNLPTNSARTDVPPFDPDGIGAPGNTYYEPDRETNKTHAADTARFVRELLARSG